MANLSLSFESGESSLSVRRFSVREGVSACFTASVWARSPDPSLDLEALVGKAASLRIESGYAFTQRGGARLWTGIVSTVEQLQPEPAGLSTYFLRIVPSLWLLGQRRNYRIFQHLTVPDIVDRIFTEWSLERVWQLDRAEYSLLEYRVQYGETDYDFVNRLLEEAGISFTFPDEDARGNKLTLGDKLHAAAARPASHVHYVDNPNQASEREFVTRVTIGHEVRPGAYVVRDHDFRKPAYPLFGAAPASAPEERLEQFHYAPGAFLIEKARSGDSDDRLLPHHDEKVGHAQATRALDGERAGKRTVAFESNVTDLWPGVIFSIDGHHHPDIDGERLLVTDCGIDGEVGREWSIRGRAVLAKEPYRPRIVTPKPRLRCVESATVVGPSDSEIYTDEFGRVKVQFPWDREGMFDSESSCWMRVSQGWAGASYGMIHLPRVGQEVLVAFLDGNPDRPIVVGRVHNQSQPVPYPLPDDKTRSTWKSDKSLGSGGFNEIMFEDRKDEELVSEQAERNRRALIKNDETITVGHDRVKQVGGHEHETTGMDRVEVTGRHRSQQIGDDRRTFIGGDRERLVKGTETEKTIGDHLLDVEKDRHILVKGTKAERVESDSHLHLQANRSELVGGTLSIRAAGEQVEVKASHGLSAGDEIHYASPIVVGEGAAGATLAGPGGFLRIDADGITIKGTLVKINTGGSVGGGSGAHPIAPSPPRAPPESAPVPTVATRTVATAVLDRARTKVGIAEEVTLTYSAGAATWTVSGGGTVTPASGSAVTYRAPDRSGVATITATGSAGVVTTRLTVVEPSGFVMEQAPGTNLRHTAGRPDCGFKGKMILQPDDVSFENIEVRELNSFSTASGFYAPFNHITHQPASQTASAWFTVNPPSGGKGSSPNMLDQIYSGDPGGGPPFTAGDLVFPCTWEFKVGSGAPRAMPAAIHRQEVDTAGKCTISKTTTRSRVPSDPTSSW